MFCRSLFDICTFSFDLCSLFFFDLWILFTPLVSSLFISLISKNVFYLSRTISILTKKGNDMITVYKKYSNGYYVFERVLSKWGNT